MLEQMLHKNFRGSVLPETGGVFVLIFVTVLRYVKHYHLAPSEPLAGFGENGKEKGRR